MFLKAARQVNWTTCVVCQQICGQEGYFGTSSQVVLDINKMKELDDVTPEFMNKDEFLEKIYLLKKQD